jgi:DNA-binding transcriptional MerR regulator
MEVEIMKKQNQTYSISQVSKMTGVNKNRIRGWHDKGLLPQVEWMPVGTRNDRRFTQDDIDLIARIDEYQKQGFVLKVAAEKAVEK